jgi:UPF0176 protein
MPRTTLVASFYRFTPLPTYRDLREPLNRLGADLNLKGTVLLAPEGINCTVGGTEADVRCFLNTIAQTFKDLEPKFSWCEKPPFQKWRVRLKKEIVTIKAPNADPTNGTGEYIEPADWNEVIQDPNTTVVDVRNKYEIEYGTFEHAINPKTDDFWEFPTFVANQLQDKSKPVALFCTGGIRCEKATAYLKANGFENVKHLRGGILKYLQEIPKEKSLWQGSCFVFDEREALDHNLDPIK